MNKKEISIREFKSDDLVFLSNLTNALGYPTTVEQMTKRMETVNQLRNYWTYVAVIDKNVIGYMGLNKNYFWEQDGSYIRIQALVVDEKYRRLGVGQKLTEFAEKLARRLNIKAIILNCGNREERQAAHLFYAKMGFVPKSTGYIKRLE